MARRTVRPPTPESKTPIFGLAPRGREVDAESILLMIQGAPGTRALIQSGRDPCLFAYILKRKRNRNIWILFSVDLDIGIDKVIQRRTVLRRLQFQVASLRELHAIHIVRAEEIIVLLLMLPRLRNVKFRRVV
jgi:hypothetical protein